MEKLVEELQSSKPEQEAPATVSPRPAPTSSSIQQSPLPRRKASSASPSSGNPDFHPSPPSVTSSTKSRPYYIGGPDDSSVVAAGTSSLLSAQGVAQIELLIGDARFTNALYSLRTKVMDLHQQPFLSPADLNNPLPPNHVIIDCVNEYLTMWNEVVRIFQEHELRDALRSYTQGQPSADPGWLMALNAILAHIIRDRNCMRNKEEYQKYIYNALGMVPNIILRTPTPMTIGALLLTVDYFNFTSENHIAMSLMGLTVQLLMMAGYHRLEEHSPHPDPQIDPVNRLHRRRLFWRAYILDHDLMLRMGKPPLISNDFLLDLPEEHPADGYGIYCYPDGVTLNFFRQQVRLAQIQGHIAAALYSRIDTPLAELEAEIRRLDAELQEWRESIPPMFRAENAEALLDGDYRRMAHLTVLHFTYFQLVVAIHSAAFRLPSLGDQEGTETIDIGPSLALCVGASRASISLLNYHQVGRIFTPFLLYQVAWSVDILFVNIIQNRTNPRAHRDLELIRNLIGFFEKYDPLHQSVVSYHTIKVMADVAASVLANTPTLPPHMLPAPLGPSPIPEQSPQAAPSTAGVPVGAFSSLMGGAGPVGSGGISSGGTADMLRSMTTLSMSDTQHQGFMGIAGEPMQPNESQFFPGFVNMAADWRLPMDFQPELWQYDSVLTNQFPNQNVE
ncbi:fungal-specific transcription factor domain-containing protein [Colletotrichum navitas]|uniref:Fungal-specific transcription factor domain-containing protein n=1 Tax=Colletotrichum navitas TaxID=681940 RepID=A0AAD8Q612_9PEZI|nr:fungal-specific transcription factor domain-containing protein [Colletotrichum navitas]KAK1595903.1 fungal-specific transcription factor domain-containing protein [Colletotrichum navitas]